MSGNYGYYQTAYIPPLPPLVIVETVLEALCGFPACHLLHFVGTCKSACGLSLGLCIDRGEIVRS